MVENRIHAGNIGHGVHQLRVIERLTRPAAPIIKRALRFIAPISGCLGFDQRLLIGQSFCASDQHALAFAARNLARKLVH